MIVWLGPRIFVMSNDSASIILRSTVYGTWRDLRELGKCSFNTALGVVNSSDMIEGKDGCHLVLGHANGFVSVCPCEFGWPTELCHSFTTAPATADFSASA